MRSCDTISKQFEHNRIRQSYCIFIMNKFLSLGNNNKMLYPIVELLLKKESWHKKRALPSGSNSGAEGICSGAAVATIN